MKQLKSICLLLMLALLPLPLMANDQKEDGEALNIPELVLEHLADAYEWHITTIGDKHIGFDLPIIIRSSQTGEWVFCTAHTLPEGFFFNEEAHGKIYERMADGTAVRPLDLSITRNVLQIWIVVAVLLVVFLCCARWPPAPPSDVLLPHSCNHYGRWATMCWQPLLSGQTVMPSTM